MIVTKKHLDRRMMLKGLGATVALPFLDAMIPAFAPVRAAAPVRRFGAIYVGMGVNVPQWTPPPDETLQLSPILQPIEAFKDQTIVLTGLDNASGYIADGGQHPRLQTSWLTGVLAKRTEGVDLLAGTSLDQIVAAEAGKETQLNSLELSIESVQLVGACAEGYGCAYNNTLSWRTPTTPLPMENNPRAVFERLFGASDTTDTTVRARELRRDRSVLDSVIEKVTTLNTKLGPKDRSKLVEYLDAVRDVERRVQKAEEQVNRELPVVDRPSGIPATFQEHCELMFDLQTLAFQTDLTRVFSFLMIREASVRSYPELGVPDSHHPLSHHQNMPEKLEKQAKLNTFHVKMLTYFLEKLKTTQDGSGSLLDQTLVLYGSGMSDSNLHMHENVPTVLVAGKTFDLKGGRHIRAPKGTPLTNLQLTMMDRLGMPMEKFGDSNGELKLLSV